MITLRQHAVSIAAIFLALAIGLVLGSQSLSAGVLSGLRNDKSDLEHQLDSLRTEQNRRVGQLAAADNFDAAMSTKVLRDALAQKSVLVFSTPDAAAADVDGVVAALSRAGATIAGRLALAPAFWDPAEADRLRTMLTNLIPAGVQLRTDAVDSGSLAGDLLGAVLQLHPTTGKPQSTSQELALALDTLRRGNFLGYGTAPVRPGQLAVVVTGDGGNASSAAVVARFAGALRPRGGGTVLAGRLGAAEGTGPIAVVRADSALSSVVSTVDDIDREAGRITVALALAEQAKGASGRYGTGPNAAAVTVGTAPGG